MGKHAAGSAATDPVDIRITTGGLTASEIAAVTAVVTAAVHEQASDARQAEPTHSAWELSARRLRTPLKPGPGAWVRATW